MLEEFDGVSPKIGMKTPKKSLKRKQSKMPQIAKKQQRLNFVDDEAIEGKKNS